MNRSFRNNNRNQNSGSGRRGSQSGSKKKIISNFVDRGVHKKTERKVIEHDLSSISVEGEKLIRIESPRYRTYIDTFLKNTSRCSTAFRSALQGADGNFLEACDGVIFAEMDGFSPVSAIIINPDLSSFVHAIKPESIKNLLNSIIEPVKIRSIEGEKSIIESAMETQFIESLEVSRTDYYTCYEFSSGNIEESKGSKQRLATLDDCDKLDNYFSFYTSEVSADLIPPDWRQLTDEKRVLFEIHEGNVASVIIKKHELVDQIFIDGLFTFPSYRKRGFATRLISTVLAQAIGKKKTVIGLVPNQNLTTIKLVEKLGFRKIAEYSRVSFKT